MKRTLLRIAALISIIMLGGKPAAVAQQAYYLYLNDGSLEVFYTDMVDSMTVSPVNNETGKQDRRYGYQNVYTNDSIYQFPLEQIDSISFVAPETVLKPGVIDLEEGLIDYVISCDSLTLTLSTETPKRLRPRIGDKLVFAQCTDLFPSGFAGEVEDVTVEQSGIIVECTLADLTEIFECYYGGSDQDEEAKAPDYVRGPQASTEAWWDDIIGNGEPKPIERSGEFTWNPGPMTYNLYQFISGYISHGRKTLSVDNLGFTLTVTPSLITRGTLIISHGETYFSFQSVGKHTLQEVMRLSGELEYEIKPLENIAHFSIPIPACPFLKGYVEPGVFFKAKAEAAVTAEFTYTFNTAVRFSWSNKGNTPLKNVPPRIIPTGTSHRVEGLLSGEIAAGGYFEFGIEIADRNIAKAYGKYEVGAKLSGELIIDEDELAAAEESTELFERLRKSSIYACPYQAFGVGAEAFTKLKKKIPLDLGLSVGADLFLREGNHWFDSHFVPTFSDLEFWRTNDETLLKTVIGIRGDQDYLPTSIGIVVRSFDANGYSDPVYSSAANTFGHPRNLDFVRSWNCDKDVRLKFQPYIEFFGRKVLALPSMRECAAEISDMQLDRAVSSFFGTDSYQFQYSFRYVYSDNLSDAVSQGCYLWCTDNSRELWKYPSVQNNYNTIGPSLNFTDDGSTEIRGGVKLDFTNYVAEIYPMLGSWITRTDEYGQEYTAYSAADEYTLRYNQRPSIRYENPRIVDNNTVEMADITYDISVSGAFWMENLQEEMLNGWVWDSNGEAIKSIGGVKDGNSEKTATFRLYNWFEKQRDSNGASVFHFHLKKKSTTLHSNYLNWSFRDGTMTSVWVANTPAPKITSAKQVGIEPASVATSAETQSKKFEQQMPAKDDAPKGRIVGIKPEYADLLKEGLQESIR